MESQGGNFNAHVSVKSLSEQATDGGVLTVGHCKGECMETVTDGRSQDLGQNASGSTHDCQAVNLLWVTLPWRTHASLTCSCPESPTAGVHPDVRRGLP